MAVQVRHSVAHDQVVDLAGLEHCRDRTSGTLHICPECAQLIGRHVTKVGDVLAEYHHAVAGVRLVV
jgi:hypothetical protein